MIRQTLFVPLAGCLLALACAQANAAPNPYSSFIVFGDSLNDAGTFADAGGPAGSTERYTNRTGPVYQDGSGEVYSLNSTQLLGARLASVPTRQHLPARPYVLKMVRRTATTGRSAVIALTRFSIRSPASRPPANARAPVTCHRTAFAPIQMRSITFPVAVTTFCRAAFSACPKPTPPPIGWPTVCKPCKPPAPNT